MDPLSIAAASFSIAGAVAKASVAIFEFSRDAKDAADDLSRVNRELQALTSILDPLARSLSKATPDGTVSEGLARQLESSLEGCALVLDQLQQLIRKYQREGAWTRTKWVMLGRGDLEKLRESLEAYKMALSLGLHVISMAIEENIQRDTSVLRNDTRVLQEYATGIKINTDEILARVNSIRHGRYNRASSPRVQQWIDEIEILTSYAETTYHGTTVRPEDLDSAENSDEEWETPVGEAGLDEELEDSRSDVSPPHTLAETTEMQPEPAGKFRPAGEGRLDLVVAIDIGDTSTAVAWMAYDTPVQIISAWPGGSGTRVPTSVAYGAQGELSSWGFQCAEGTHSNPSLTALMDDTDNNHASQLSPHENSRRLADFLRCLYGHVREVISSALGARQQVWAEMAIEFHFTLPDAFRRARGPSCERLTKTLKHILRGVGIGTAKHHYAILGLAATEAASIAALGKKPPRAPDELLVFLGEECAALLWGNLAVDSLSRGESYVGSVRCLPRFDDVFAEYVLERLRSYPEVEGRLGDGVARELVTGPDFRAVAAVVEGSAPRRGCYALRADGIPPSFRHEGLAIAGGEMRFTHQQVELVQSRRFKGALDAVEAFIGAFPTLPGIKREGHKISGVTIVSKEVTRMTQYIADMLPLALKWKGLGQITASTFGDQASQEAAVFGVLIRRGAWSDTADLVRVHFVDEYLRLSAWPREPSGLLRLVRGGRHSWKVSATSAGKTIINFTTDPDCPKKPVCLCFDVFYSFNNNQVSAPRGSGSVGTTGGAGLTMLCTIQTKITEDCFKAQVHRDKWYRSGKVFYEVSVTLGPFVTKKDRAGPEVTVRAGGVRCMADVTWYFEPPQIVWQREYSPHPAEDMRTA